MAVIRKNGIESGELGTPVLAITQFIIYVFGFIETILTFPLYCQQMVRLGEIARRLGSDILPWHRVMSVLFG